MRAVRADHLRVYEYLALRLLPMTGGGYLADGTPPEVHSDLSAAINAQASEGWELDRFVPQNGDIWLVFRRTNGTH